MTRWAMDPDTRKQRAEEHRAEIRARQSIVRENIARIEFLTSILTGNYGETVDGL